MPALHHYSQLTADSIRGWEPESDCIEDTLVGLDFGTVDLSLIPPSQLHRVMAATSGDSTSVQAASSPHLEQRIMTREFTRRQGLTSPASSTVSFQQSSQQHPQLAGSTVPQIPSTSSQTAPFIPWHVFPPAAESSTSQLSTTSLQPHHLPSPPQTRDHSPFTSRAPSLAQHHRHSAPALTSSSPAPTAPTKFSRASGGRRHRSSTERKIERKRAENANYIPRPKNSFILFRTDFVARHKKEAEASGRTTSEAVAAANDICGDDEDGLDSSRSLSKQASDVWNRMSEEDKVPWQDRAEKEKLEHARKYPHYRYRPVRNLSQQGPQSSPLAPHPEESLFDAAVGQSGGGFVSAGGREMSGSVSPTQLSKEEVQKRRCDLVYDLMQQGYRGAELTSALLVCEGNFMLPAQFDTHPPPAPPSHQIPFTISPEVQFSAIPLSSPLRRKPTTLAPTPLYAEADASEMVTPRFLPSSSSLSCALAMPIPRSPSVPLIKERPALDFVIPNPAGVMSIPSTLVRSCPSTPQGRLLDAECVETIGCVTTNHEEEGSEAGSAVSSASSAQAPPQSMPPSPEEESGVPLGGPLPFFSNRPLARFGANALDIYSYDPHASQHDLKSTATTPASTSAPDVVHADLMFGLTTSTTNTASTSYIPSYQQQDTVFLNPTPVTPFGQPSLEQLQFSRPPLEVVADLWAGSNQQQVQSLFAPESQTTNVSSADSAARLPQLDQLRTLTGLPSPPLSSVDVSSEIPTFNTAEPTQDMPSNIDAGVELEAYHLALGRAYAAEADSFGDYFFDLDHGFEFGGVLPESTISFSALADDAAPATGTSGYGDVDMEAGLLARHNSEDFGYDSSAGLF